MHPFKTDEQATNKRVILESPLAWDSKEEKERNLSYAKDCLTHSLWLGEAPVAFHLLYPKVAGGILRDEDTQARNLGLWCGNRWLKGAQLVAFYTDHGMTSGMEERLELAQDASVRIKFRTLPTDDSYLEEMQSLRQKTMVE